MKVIFKEVVNALCFGLALIVVVIIGAVGSGLVGGVIWYAWRVFEAIVMGFFSLF